MLAAARAAAPADRAAEAARLAEEQAQAKEWRMRAEAAAAASAAQRQSEAAAVAEANRQRILEQYAASGSDGGSDGGLASENGGVEDWELWGDPREVHHTHVCACSCACHRCCRTISVCMGISVHATPGQYHK